MKILAISGSTRSMSTNRALLKALRNLRHESNEITVDESIHTLVLATAENTAALKQFLTDFHQFIDQTKTESSSQEGRRR